MKAFASNLGAKVLRDEKCRNWLMQSIFGGNKDLLSASFGALSVMTAVAEITPDDGTQGPNALMNFRNLPGVDVVLNSAGAYFSASVSVGFGYGASIRGGTDRAKAFILLHEFAHKIGVISFDHNDGCSRNAQISNNNAIGTNCAKTLGGFSNSR